MLVCFDFAPIYHGRQQHGDGANKKKERFSQQPELGD
jgi:hypothetical protein